MSKWPWLDENTNESWYPFKDIPEWWDPENPQHQLWATMRSVNENLTVMNNFPQVKYFKNDR